MVTSKSGPLNPTDADGRPLAAGKLLVKRQWLRYKRIHGYGAFRCLGALVEFYSALKFRFGDNRGDGCTIQGPWWGRDNDVWVVTAPIFFLQKLHRGVKQYIGQAQTRLRAQVHVPVGTAQAYLGPIDLRKMSSLLNQTNSKLQLAATAALSAAAGAAAVVAYQRLQQGERLSRLKQSIPDTNGSDLPKV